MRVDVANEGVTPRGLPPHVSATLLIAGSLLLGGCAVGPNFKKPKVAVNEQWSAKSDPRIASQTASDGQWWKVFRDPTLDRLIEVAHRQNLPLQVAGLRIVEARAMLAVATGRQYPQVQILSGSVNAVGLPKQVANVTGLDRNFAAYDVGFDAAWELDFWGKYRRGVETETASLLATVADYYSGIVSVTAEVARTYAVFRTFQELIAQAEQNTSLQTESLRIAESRFSNGATSELDVTQATTLLESTRASVPQLRTGARQAQNALSTLLGQPAGALDALLATPGPIPVAPASVSVSVPAEMLRRRPDIRSAELLAAAQCGRIGIAKAELYPSFTLFGSIGLRANTAGLGPKNLFSTDSGFYGIGPQVRFPFLNYGRITNSVRVQDARFQQLLVGYRNAVLKAAQEVEDALVGFLNAQEATALQQRSVAAAQRSQELALVQYREGAVDYQRVLDAQRFLLQQENSLAQTRSSVATNLVALYKALGGGWEVSEGQPFVPEQMQDEMRDRTNWGDMLSEPRSPETKHPPKAGKH